MIVRLIVKILSYTSPCFAIIANVMSAGEQLAYFSDGEHKTSRNIKGAPLDSLFAQFCLHALWFGNCNIRGMY